MNQSLSLVVDELVKSQSSLRNRPNRSLTTSTTTRIIAVLIASVTWIHSTSVNAEPPAISLQSETLDLLVLTNKPPARLSLQIEIGGRSVPAIWDETFAKLFAFHDRDENGSLDRAEAGSLPSPFALRQVLWGQFATFSGAASLFAEVDLNADDKISGDELADYYRRAGLGGALVAIGRPAATEQMTDAILKHLDTNNDGHVSEAEGKLAAESLGKLDQNDDELIGPGELVENATYPGATGSMLLTAPKIDWNSIPTSPDGTKNSRDGIPIDKTLPFIVLPQRPSEAPTANRINARATTWRISIGEQTLTQHTIAIDNLRIELRSDAGKLTDQTAAARKRFAAFFAEHDLNSDGILDEKELSATRIGQLKPLAEVADRNSDGCLSEQELTTWLDLQAHIAKGHVLLTMIDRGHGLYELLDADHDGSLSVRELRSVWVRLKTASCVTGDRFDRAKLPRCFLATVSHGHPVTAIGKPTHFAPDWFTAMDRNGDGDVSRLEFLGSASEFRKLDRDQDGLIDITESNQAAPDK
jgi:Ca2+-binding EF-hand superfamily protein